MNRLILGDCLNELPKLQVNSIDLLCTDPPYGDNVGYGRNNRTILGNSSPLVGLQALEACWPLLKRNTAAYFFLDIKHHSFVERFVSQYTDFRIKDCLVWDKVHIGMGRGFRRRHELIMALEKGSPTYQSQGFPNVLTERRVTTAEHPHKKPLVLLKRLIGHSTTDNDVVLDPFAGVGTTLLAAKTLGRRYLGIEANTTYVDIARRALARI